MSTIVTQDESMFLFGKKRAAASVAEIAESMETTEPVDERFAVGHKPSDAAKTHLQQLKFHMRRATHHDNAADHAERHDEYDVSQAHRDACKDHDKQADQHRKALHKMGYRIKGKQGIYHKQGEGEGEGCEKDGEGSSCMKPVKIKVRKDKQPWSAIVSLLKKHAPKVKQGEDDDFESVDKALDRLTDLLVEDGEMLWSVAREIGDDSIITLLEKLEGDGPALVTRAKVYIGKWLRDNIEVEKCGEGDGEGAKPSFKKFRPKDVSKARIHQIQKQNAKFWDKRSRQHLKDVLKGKGK